MIHRDEEFIEALKSTLVAQQNEIQLLSERADESLLLRLVAESVATIEDPAILLETILEKISILEDIPFCACGEHGAQGLSVFSSYAAFETDGPVKNQVDLSPEITATPIETVYTLTSEDLQRSPIKIKFKKKDFFPSCVVLCPLSTKSFPNGVFLFADAKENSNRLANITPLLQNIARMASEKLDKMALLDELTELNKELERRVQLRTQSLFEANKQLQTEISEKIQMQELMLQSEKMRSIGLMVSGMAHEIRNPLAGIVQNANTIVSRLTNMELSANQEAADRAGISLTAMQNFLEDRKIFRMLSAVRDSGQRIADLVDNMLRFSRKSSVHRLPCQLTKVLDKAYELASTAFNLKTAFDFKNIELRKEYEEGLPLIPCDEGKIQQVFLNILHNGAQAMNEGIIMARQNGKEPKPPRFILRVAADAPNTVRVEIEDNGPGMDATTQSRVFEPFFTTKPPGEGTGLGLGICYFIIKENHGGSLTIKSAPGEGATFIIRLPQQPHVPKSAD